MRNRLVQSVLRIAAAGRVRTAALALAAGVSVAAGASPAGAKPYGRGEDLLLRLDQGVAALAALAPWVFYLLAAFVGGCALLRFKTHFDPPKQGAAPLPGGLAMPVVGMLIAIALLAAPTLVDACVEGLSLEYRPAGRLGRDS